ncbi:MAG: transcription termination factor NusA [Candidatus Marinimicrobia bacterium]|nr:transcription termination factor NusA [Candidatus Neomarinimicrobiota bacterium]
MISSEIISAFSSIAKEKNIERERLSEIIENVFTKLIEKKFGENANFDVIVNMEKGEIEIYHYRTVVEEVEDEINEISVEEAQEIEPDLEAGDPYVDIIDPGAFGRRNISHAKQILNQEIIKVERNVIYEEYKDKVGEVIIGDIHQIRRNAVYIHLGKAELKMPRSEQIRGERYRRGDDIKVYIKDAVMTPKGPEIIASRADNRFLEILFENEVPEIYDQTIEIVKIAREPGDRSKVIVRSNDKRIDAVGACVGIKGSRIQAIVRELNNEKIDVINASSHPEILITRALSPAKPYMLEIDEEKKEALAIFEDDDISIAIGKGGQNIRLASEVTGYEIDAQKRSEYEMTGIEQLYLEDIEGIKEHEWKILNGVGIETAEELMDASRTDLMKIDSMKDISIQEIEDTVEKALEERKAQQEAEAEAAEEEDQEELEESETTEEIEETEEEQESEEELDEELSEDELEDEEEKTDQDEEDEAKQVKEVE